MLRIVRSMLVGRRIGDWVGGRLSVLRPIFAPDPPGIWADPVNGNDGSGDGSRGNPYLTIGKALSVMSNGDTLNLKSGTFRETNSTALVGITIRAGNNYAPVLVPSQTVLYTAWTKTGGRTNVYQIADASAQTWGVWNGGQLLAPLASIAAVDAQTNSQFLDTTGHILYVNIGGGAPTAINSEDNANPALTLSGGGGALLNLTFQWAGIGLELAGGNNYSISGCTFQYMAGPFSNDWGSIVSQAGTGHVVSGCTFRVNDVSHISGIIVTTNAGQALTVSNCTFDTLFAGIKLVKASTVTASDCTFSNIGPGNSGNIGNGIGAENGEIYTVNATRCTFIDCAHAGIVIYTVGSVLNAKFCLVYLTRDTADRSYGFVIDAGGGSYYHCTVANLNRSTFPSTQMAFYRNGGAGTIDIKNCIVYNCGRDFFNAGTGTQTFTEDYNDSYLTEHGNDWGPGAHDITTDPLFVSSAGNDYHLQAGSPCRGAGVALPGVNDGATTLDIGRYVTGLP